MFKLLLAPYLKGLVLMASLIIAIGVQNAFVLRQGVRRQFVFTSASICFLCDIVMVGIGTQGLGVIIGSNLLINSLIAFGGAIFLMLYALRSFHAAREAQGLTIKNGEIPSWIKTVILAFSVSALNPHAMMDTMVLVGGVAGRYEGAQRWACALGAITSSAIWFYGLGYGARWLAPYMVQAKVWSIIDFVIGVMMSILALTLLRDGILILQELKIL